MSHQHVSLSSLATIIFPMYDRSSASGTYLPDRTFLGGPNSIRGWKVGGIGLRDGPDSLGGDLSWAMGMSLFAPLPGIAQWPLRLHSFVNLGKVVGYDSGCPHFAYYDHKLIPRTYRSVCTGQRREDVSRSQCFGWPWSTVSVRREILYLKLWLTIL